MPARSPVKNTKTPGTSPALLPRHPNTKSRQNSERRSRCCSRISNAFSGWDGYDYAVHAARMTNSSSPQPPRTFVNSPRSFLHRSKRGQPDKKGTRASSSATFLRAQHAVFQHNRIEAAVRCAERERLQCQLRKCYGFMVPELRIDFMT